MQIVFVRHGEAEEAGHGVPDADAGRRLVKAGKRESRKVAGALNYLGLKPNIILTSPLVRAYETAKIMAKRIKKAPDPLTTDALKPGGRWQAFKKEVARHVGKASNKKKRDCIVYAVGHQPDLSRMISEALCGTAVEFRLEKSACISLRWENPGMQGPPAIAFAVEADVL